MADREVVAGGGPLACMRRILVPLVAALVPLAATLAAVPVRVDVTSSAALEGELLSIDREAVVLEAAGAERRIPIAEVRVVRLRDERPVATDGPQAGPRVEVTGLGGLHLAGEDLAWEGTQATLVCGGERIELPVERIRRVVWRTDDRVPEWLAAVPEAPASDLLVVTRGDAFEIVECAVVGVSADTVVVTLDGERIPVKRGKVLGIVMLGQPSADGDGPLARVVLAAGRVGGASVVWRDETLVVDDRIRVPGGLVESIDLAAARTVALVDLPLDSSTSEPTFVATDAVDGLAEFFAPRIVRPDGAAPAWLMRPTSTATWRIPATSRRCHGRVTAAGGGAAAAVDVVLRPDVGEAWRCRLDAGRTQSFDLAATAARRLTIEIAPVDGGVGFPVRIDAAFEK